MKTYNQTGTYVFLKKFKKATECAEFECVQRLSLSSEELLKLGKSIRAQTSEISDTVENKDKPQSNCKRARKSQISSNLNIFKHDSNYVSFRKWQKLCSKMGYLIISKNFNQISNLLILKKFLDYLILIIMLLEATSNLNIALFPVDNEKKSHYHILIQVDSEEQLNQFFSSQKSFSVPCIFTCFKYLVSPTKDVKGNGELFDKLKLALTYSAQPVAAKVDLLDFTAIKKRLPNLLLSATSSNKQTSPNQNVCKKSRAVGG